MITVVVITVIVITRVITLVIGVVITVISLGVGDLSMLKRSGATGTSSEETGRFSWIGGRRMKVMDLPMKGEVRGTPVNVSLPPGVIEALDEARGKLNRQQYIRKILVERLKLDGYHVSGLIIMAAVFGFWGYFVVHLLGGHYEGLTYCWQDPTPRVCENPSIVRAPSQLITGIDQ